MRAQKASWNRSTHAVPLRQPIYVLRLMIVVILGLGLGTAPLLVDDLVLGVGRPILKTSTFDESDRHQDIGALLHPGAVARALPLADDSLRLTAIGHCRTAIPVNAAARPLHLLALRACDLCAADRIVASFSCFLPIPTTIALAYPFSMTLGPRSSAWKWELSQYINVYI